jgi:hypothetical protein
MSTPKLYLVSQLCLATLLVAASPSVPDASKKSQPQKAEPKSAEAKSVEPSVQSEIGNAAAEQRSHLLKDAQAALDETQNAIKALDKGDKKAALAALERATGKLDVVVSRDPKLALAPVSVTTVIMDLYATPDAVKAIVKHAKDDLASNHVQQARTLMEGLASEADIEVAEIPLATYPAAIKAVVPLIDQGKTDEAKAALYAALNTLVVDTYVLPLPKLRAQAMLREADKLAAKSNRSNDENKRLHSLIEGARSELQLAEALGYGVMDNYKPLYTQLDDVEKKTGAGQSGKGFFDRLHDSIKNFKFRS